MRTRPSSALLWVSLLAALIHLAACDALPSAVAGGDDAPLAEASERPEGWQSLDDEASAVRMYYQFVDARGRVRFVERIDDVPEAWRGSVGFVKMAVPPPLTPADAEQARRRQVARRGATIARSDVAGSTVILYSADWCGACRKAKRYLDARGVAYEERNVDVPSVAQELLGKTGQRGIPVIDVDGRIATGFSPASYDALIDRA